MAPYKPYTSQTLANPEQPAITEFDILKASHKFLRDDTEAEASTSWNDQLAKKYYDSLYREFAICDLKHYKSGNFALRWRTETEVLDGTGETSCANARCEHHRSSSLELTALELPFAYEERGAPKEALVKIVLCPRCVRKLLWKRRHDKSDVQDKDVEAGPVADKRRDREGDEPEVKQLAQKHSPRVLEEGSVDGVTLNPRERRRRSSRSRSPRTHRERQEPSSVHATQPRRQDR
ncbi:hypothetical protein BS17DRAFT_781196 [Gyrodon lividus]|nr:hypothetical protein BS17DRAFT_781196 [Gyrodon lividus]